MGHYRFALAAELGQAGRVGYRVEFVGVESTVVVDDERRVGPCRRRDVAPGRVELAGLGGEEFRWFVGKS